MVRPSLRHDGVIRSLLTLALGAVMASCAAQEPGAPAPISMPLPADMPAKAMRADQAGPFQPARPSCDGMIAAMTPRQRLAQLLMVGIDAPESAAARHGVGVEQVGGVFLRGNTTAPLVGDGLRRLVATSATPVAVSVDDEGGRVQRVDTLDGQLPSARAMARSLRPDQVRQLAARRGAALRSRGVTMDFAPVVDLGGQPDRGVIGDRAFSPDPMVAADYAGAFAAGLRDSGVLPVVKHFPGHGRASGDSHRSAVVTPPLDQLRAADLVPYRRVLAQAPVAVMVGHLLVPGLTGGEPASLSPDAYRLLRDEYGFDGLAVTDDLGGMRAVTDRYRLPDAVLKALQAGADVALWSSGEQLGVVLDRLERALAGGDLVVERIERSVRTVLAAKSICSG